MKTIALGLIGLSLLATPFAVTPAAAQGNDSAYCGKLATAYQTYVATTHRHGETENSGPAQAAISKCQAGDYSGIPVLEKQLTDAKVDLPAH
jgi:hypothetical protein